MTRETPEALVVKQGPSPAGNSRCRRTLAVLSLTCGLRHCLGSGPLAKIPAIITKTWMPQVCEPAVGKRVGCNDWLCTLQACPTAWQPSRSPSAAQKVPGPGGFSESSVLVSSLQLWHPPRITTLSASRCAAAWLKPFAESKGIRRQCRPDRELRDGGCQRSPRGLSLMSIPQPCFRMLAVRGRNILLGFVLVVGANALELQAHGSPGQIVMT